MMSTIYLETSAALAWLLGEPEGTRVLSFDQRIASNLAPLGLASATD